MATYSDTGRLVEWRGVRGRNLTSLPRSGMALNASLPFFTTKPASTTVLKMPTLSTALAKLDKRTGGAGADVDTAVDTAVDLDLA